MIIMSGDSGTRDQVIRNAQDIKNIFHDLGEIRDDVSEIRSDIYTIKTNDLPHVAQVVNTHNRNFWLTVIGAGGGSAIVVEMIRIFGPLVVIEISKLLGL